MELQVKPSHDRYHGQQEPSGITLSWLRNDQSLHSCLSHNQSLERCERSEKKGLKGIFSPNKLALGACLGSTCKMLGKEQLNYHYLLLCTTNVEFYTVAVIRFLCHQHRIYSRTPKYVVWHREQNRQKPSLHSMTFFHCPSHNVFSALSLTHTYFLYPSIPRCPPPSYSWPRTQTILVISEHSCFGLCALGCISIGSGHIWLHSRSATLQSAKIKPQKIKRKAS